MQKNKVTRFFLADPEKQKNRWYLLLLIIIPLAIYFYFALQHLTQFETADEHLWISDPYTGRIQQYWNAIASKDWASTHINDKPGVTLALISGIGMHWEADVKSKILNDQLLWTIYNPDKSQQVYKLYRLPIVIANGIMSALFFLMLWRLTKKYWLALPGAALVMLSPTLIGISQIINPDAFLWVFSFSAILSMLLFLQKNRWWVNIIDALLTIIFLGLALLSKYVALVLFPFFLAVLLWNIFDSYQKWEGEGIFRKKIIVATIGYPLIIAGSIGIFALLMPAALVKPDIIRSSILDFGGMRGILEICLAVDLFLLFDAVILRAFISRFLSKHLILLKEILPRILYVAMVALFAATIWNWSRGGNFLHSLSFADSVKKSPLLQLPVYLQMVSETMPVAFALTPIVLALMFFAWLKSLYKRSEYDYMLFLSSIFFPVFFYAIIRQNILLQVRYSLIVFPMACLIAAIGFYELIKNLKHRYALVAFLVLVSVSFYSIRKIEPYYFAYTNDLLPKQYVISDTWGYGGYEAIRYIQSQSGPNKIYSDYYGACQFFSGRCVMEGQPKFSKTSDIRGIEYVISSSAGAQKNKAGLKAISQVFPLDNPVWQIDIDGRPDNFIKVYKNELQTQQN